MKHIIVPRPRKLCISKVPVSVCGPTCKAEQGQKVEKMVPFVCLPEGRMAEHYARKVHAGESIPELMTMETSFTTKIEQPRHCVPVSGSSGYGTGAEFKSNFNYLRLD